MKLLEITLVTLGIAATCSSGLYTVYLGMYRPTSPNAAAGFVVPMRPNKIVRFVTGRDEMISTWLFPAGLSLLGLGTAMRKRRQSEAEDAKRQALTEEERWG